MDLQKELQVLMQRQKQAEADYHAICGAIQFCNQLIEEQKREEGENEDKND